PVSGELLRRHFVGSIQQILAFLYALDAAFFPSDCDQHTVAHGRPSLFSPRKALPDGTVFELHHVMASVRGDNAPPQVPFGLGLTSGRGGGAFTHGQASAILYGGRPADGCRRTPNAPDQASGSLHCRRTA